MACRTTSRSRVAATIIACAAVLLPGLQLVTASTAGAATSSSPYSDPIWFPVRDNVQVGCIGNHSQPKNNNDSTAGTKCDKDHPQYFGMNIDAIPGKTAHPAIYAAGAGIVRAATDEPACGGTSHTGKVVEIDHGGGVVSVYEHLNSIIVSVGQHVTPSTRIGTMGHSGLSCSSSVNYLDFQVRNNGGGYLNADTTTIRTMLGCKGGTKQAWPAGLGLPYNPTSWVQVHYLDDINTSGGSCYPRTAGDSPTTPARPAVRPGSGRASVAWHAVSGANRYMILTQIYRNGSGWDQLCSPYSTRGCTAGYTAVAGGSTTAAAVTGLSNGRKYRMQLSVHNGNGWSPASAWSVVTPVSRAGAPAFRKIRATTSVAEVYWTMHKNDLHGGVAKRFQVAVDMVRHGTATRWAYYTARSSATNFTWKVRRHTVYRVKVRVYTNAGYGVWMTIHRVTTP